MPHVAVLIVAAGKGVRAGGDIPKQYAPLACKPMLRRSVEAFAGLNDTVVQVMIGPGQEGLYETAMAGLSLPPPRQGGRTRQESVKFGLESFEAGAPDFVLIHDAARPLVPRTVIDGVIEALAGGAPAAVPLLPVADTLRKQEDGKWITVPREGLMRAQTPQGFHFAPILAAHRKFAAEDVTDDMALAELAGMEIFTVPGSETNIKVTKAEDFTVAERLIAAPAGEVRVGTGFDVHKFSEGDHVWLCGVQVPHTQGLEGHSDADVALHALTDAILGAIAEGDIGLHFPPTDERWRGAASWQFLDHAAGLARAKDGVILHCDVTVICELPKVRPHSEAMRARIAEILRIDVSRVSVKATTTEKLGFTGRREGIAAQAAATVRLP
jgi:2-C-methyl-D-erythritol 4-phosphate cytidylyltransferase / 2-C-methyl-D-erythritol 2,4-cyclodiphosphate synthase